MPIQSSPGHISPSASTLKDFRPGQSGRVRALVGDGQSSRGSARWGFVEGAPVRLVRLAPFGDPLEVEIHGYHLSLRRAEAEMVLVDSD